MDEYQPTSRRPIADMFRRTADGVVRVCVRLGISPDAVSYSSVVASAAAAGCFWQSGRWIALAIPAALFCYVRLWLNMLDGDGGAGLLRRPASAANFSMTCPTEFPTRSFSPASPRAGFAIRRPAIGPRFSHC